MKEIIENQMKKLFLLAAALIFITFSGGSVWASTLHPRVMPEGGFSGEQAAKWHSAYAQYMQNTLESRTQLAARREQLLTLQAQPEPDLNQLKAIQDEIIDLRASLAHQANAYHGNINNYGAYRHMGNAYPRSGEFVGRGGFSHHRYRYNDRCPYPGGGWK
jgi:hypothetical protein